MEQIIPKEWECCKNDEIIKKYPFIEKALDNLNRIGQITEIFKVKDGDAYYKIVISSSENVYFITFHNDYLGCISVCRASYQRCDLTDGNASVDTLFKILCDIISVECNSVEP